jgi:type VI secretion system secreted protein Hcp
MAVADYFLKIEGIDGESGDAKHKGAIEVTSWYWGAAQVGSHASGGGGGAGKASLHDFHFVMPVNTATVKLMLACVTGDHIKKAVLTCRKAGGKQEEFFEIVMSDLLVSSYQTGAHGRSTVVPEDQISLNFSKIEFQYKMQKPDGSLGAPIKGGWDVKANKKV